MQTKKQSFFETVIQTSIGFLISLITWYAILWANIFDVEMNFGENLLLTSIFTAVSVIRGYIIRRFFNRRDKYEYASVRR